MSTSKKFIHALCAPGAKGAIEEVAPTQHIARPAGETNGTAVESDPAQNVSGFVPRSKGRRLDRWLDLLVQVSGSEPVFLLILMSLLTWAFLGIPYGNSTSWAVIISDAQAIISYVFDSLLMRQQLNSYDRLIRVSASLMSRSHSHRRMLRAITRGGRPKTIDVAQLENLQRTEFTAELPTENLLGRISTLAGYVVGHIITVVLFWAGIFIWLGFGSSTGWSNAWQLYINSATSALMVLIFAFLANIRERHAAYMEKCLNLIFEVDSAVERRLRTITGDTVPNPTIIIPAPKVGKVQRVIFYYADVVGTLVGIAILIVVMVVWVSIGPAMSFDANWWLLIGTYAGLVGLNDGFVLRNVQAHLGEYEEGAFEQADLEDMNVFMDAGIPDPKEEHRLYGSINYRLSNKMGIICAHEVTVILGVLFIVGLLIGASVMKWTETGQLLCNIPPSIVESFFMMILITGHNISESRRRVYVHNMYIRRLRLLSYVDQIEMAGVADLAEKTDTPEMSKTVDVVD